ncbi:hypothetical protein ADICYQ_3838 [Cyclobacterium qasimii M12-11B]|uniref:Uncharacterized protein n=1 Tax=Cyclobacterium qasimii M12-11B TaxID=641524 RepID=S7WK91_9BACT|nr:hypothetical protein ADICYQ_3838 [Cyclobacterium qasimii M12-11B]
MVKSGMSRSKKAAAWFADHPIANNKITGGIFVLADVMSKKYAKSIKAHSTIIMGRAIDGWFKFRGFSPI